MMPKVTRDEIYNLIYNKLETISYIKDAVNEVFKSLGYKIKFKSYYSQELYELEPIMTIKTVRINDITCETNRIAGIANLYSDFMIQCIHLYSNNNNVMSY